MSLFLPSQQKEQLVDLLVRSGRISGPFQRRALIIEIGLDPSSCSFIDGVSAREFAVLFIQDLIQKTNLGVFEKLIRSISIDLHGEQEQELILQIQQLFELSETATRSEENSVLLPRVENSTATRNLTINSLYVGALYDFNDISVKIKKLEANTPKKNFLEKIISGKTLLEDTIDGANDVFRTQQWLVENMVDLEYKFANLDYEAEKLDVKIVSFSVMSGFVHKNKDIQREHTAIFQRLQTNQDFVTRLHRSLGFLETQLNDLHEYGSENKLDSPVGLLKRFRLNEYWLLEHLFDRNLTYNDEVESLKQHIVMVIEKLTTCPLS